MRSSVFDGVIDRAIVPLVALFVVLPGLYVWHAYARRENARRGRR